MLAQDFTNAMTACMTSNCSTTTELVCTKARNKRPEKRIIPELIEAQGTHRFGDPAALLQDLVALVPRDVRFRETRDAAVEADRLPDL